MIVLDIVMLIGLCTLFYYQYRRTGVLFLPSTVLLLTGIILAMYVAYPLATTPESLVTIGQVRHFRTIQWGVNETLVIVTVGVICAVLCYILTGLFFARALKTFSKTSFVSRSVSMNDVVLGACLTTSLALVYIFYSYYQAGVLPLLSSNPLYWRAALAQSVGGSFYLGALVVSSVGAVFLMAALALGKIQSYRLLSIVCVVMACFANLATASRGTLLSPFVSAGLIYYSAKQKKLTFLKMFAICVVLLVLAAGLQAYRYHDALSWSTTETEILHGNTFFSNFRDTGWTLAYFELGRYNFLHGKTILAGLLGFIPHSAGTFRSQYRWGTFALRVVGDVDPTTHYGLAHVYFADWYVNFGYPGVIIEGVLFGFILRFVDERLLNIRQRAKNLNEFDCYGAFRIWTWSSILIGLMSSAAAPFMYPYMGGLIAIRAFTIAFRKISQGLRAVVHMPPQPVFRYVGSPPNPSRPGMRAAPPARKF